MNHLPHVCLVSDQPLPNLIPALMLKPTAVHLVITADKIAEGRRLQRLLEEQGIRVIRHADAPASNLPQINEFALKVAEQLEADGPCVLNLTGGTKLMSLGFFHTLTSMLPHTQAIYTDTRTGQIESLTRESSSIALEPVLNVPLYLRAYGLNLQSAQNEQTRWLDQADRLKPLTKWLAQNAGAIEGFIGKLNDAAQSAGGGSAEHFRARQPLEAWGKGADALSQICLPEYGLLDRISDGTVAFKTAEAVAYLAGGWMEHLAWHTLNDLHLPGLDIRCGAQVLWAERENQRRAPNELDLVAVYRNRMLLIECKTARFGNNAQKDQDILNRLDSLGRNAGGLFSTTLLLSARRLSDEVRARAAALRIQWIDCTNLGSFRKAVEEWTHA